MKISLITPAHESSRTGNRTTAERWAVIFEKLGHAVRVEVDYEDEPADLMVALHAWRSSGSVERFRARWPERPLVVALSGTDIYHYLQSEPARTLRSLDLADALVGLHDLVPEAIPARYHGKLSIIFQSAAPPGVRPAALQGCFEVVVVGHLRDEKDPLCAAAAARLLPPTSRVQVVHLGGAMSPAWAERAEAEMHDNPRYHWRGEVDSSVVRATVARARLMVLSSLMEGGANVISEAVMAGTPVIASDIAGSIGLLGRDYPGYYPAGNAGELARLVAHAERDGGFLSVLREHCAARAPLFHEEREVDAWRELLAHLSVRKALVDTPVGFRGGPDEV